MTIYFCNRSKAIASSPFSIPNKFKFYSKLSIILRLRFPSKSLGRRQSPLCMSIRSLITSTKLLLLILKYLFIVSIVMYTNYMEL